MAEKMNNSFQDSEDDIVLDRSETFAADNIEEAVNNDESSDITSEKADEYIENLMDEELAQAEAEAEAELKKDAKRKKDKAKAREKEKRAHEEANKKHEQDLAREKERLINQERAGLDNENRSFVNDNSKPIENRQEDFSSSGSVQFENVPRETSFGVSDTVPTYSGESTDVPQTPQRIEPSSDSAHFAMLTNDEDHLNDNKDNASKDIQGKEIEDRFSISESSNEYAERKFKEKRDVLYEERLEQQRQEKEQNEAFREKIQQNAYEKQRASEQYQSFGSEGIDYSGNDRHSAYMRTGEDTVITEPVYQAIREDYEKSKAECRSYGSHVPEDILEQYRKSSELYFATERRIHEGSLVVTHETPPSFENRFESVPGGVAQSFATDNGRRDVNDKEFSREQENVRNNGADFRDGSRPSGFRLEHDSVIADTEYRTIRENYENSKAEVRSYKGFAPAEVIEKYRQTSELYFSAEKKINDGSLVVKPESEVLRQTEKVEQPGFAERHNYNRDDNKFNHPNTAFLHRKEDIRRNDVDSSSAALGSQEPRGFYRNENSARLSSNRFAFGGSYQDMARRAHEVFVQTQSNDTYEQPKSKLHRVTTNERVSESSDSRVYQISQERYEALKAKQKASMDEVASYKSKNIPDSILRRNEQINRLYRSVEDKIAQGTVNVVPSVGYHRGSHFENEGRSSTSHKNVVVEKPSVYPGNSQNPSHRTKNDFRTERVVSQSGQTSSDGARGTASSAAYHISQERYDSLKTKYKASMAEMASYRGRDIPASVLRRNEQINRIYRSVEDKIARGTVSVVPSVGYHRGSHLQNDRGSLSLHKDNVVETSSVHSGSVNGLTSRIHNISKERYDSLKMKYRASVAEVNSYEGRKIPASVLKRNEQISKLYSSIKEKVNSGQVNIVSESRFNYASRLDSRTNNGNNINQPPNRVPNVVFGSQIISELNKHNYSAKSERTGDGHRKPPKTPFQASPLRKYDKLKIYHSRNYLAPFEQGTRRAVGALGSALVYAARSEQSGAVNTMVSGEQRVRDTVNTLKVLKETPRNITAAYYVTKDAAVTARNVVRFFEGKEALAHKSHKPLTIKQLDKQLRNPFAGAEKIKIDKKFGANANLVESQINRKIIIKQSQNGALKNEIKRLQAKGSALTSDERKQLKALMDKRKAANVDPRKLHGLKKARQEAMKRNRGVDRLSEKSAKKTIKKTTKNGLKLSKKDKMVVAHLRDREALLNKRKKLLKAKNARKQLTTSLSTILTRAASESEDSAVQSILNADRVLQNRYVRSILRFSTKAALLPMVPVKKIAGVGLKKIDNKFGVSNTVEAAVNTVKQKAVDKVVNSRVYKEVNGELYKRAKKQLAKHTPEKIKTRVKKVNKTVNDLNDKRKKILGKFNDLKKRLANSRLGRAVSSVSKGLSNIFSALGVVKKTLYQIGLYCAGFLIIIAMVGAAISSAGAAVSSLVLSDSNATEDGKVDLTDYYAIILDEWNVYIEDLNKQGLEAGGQKIVVNMDPFPSNAREILSMMAVRMSQDLDLDKNGDIEPYLRFLVRQLNPFYSETTYISCSKKGCSGDHPMITYNITPSYFGPQEDLNDPIFSVDTMSNTGHTAITGGLIGNFKITYYCAEKYPHICNAGPPYKTATGTVVTAGRTIAVDPLTIPLGSHVIIDGHEYTAEDTGGAIKGKRIDIAVATHNEALSKGTRTNVPVYTVGFEGGSIEATGEWQGWNEGNIEWAKNIYYQDWSELYSGLPAGTAGGGGVTDLSGVQFVDGTRSGNNKIVEIAKTQAGYSGGQKFWSWWPFSSYQPWCACFASWCAEQAGVLDKTGRFAYCPSWVDSFSSKGQWACPGDVTPVAGDIIFFDWELDGTTDHVGIVIGSDENRVYTVEGNSGNYPGVVKVKSYGLNYKCIYGYGLPNY